MKHDLRRWLIGLAIALAAGSSSAQEFRSTISGTVRDTQGLAIPAATVRAVNVDTDATSPAVTGDAGQFTLPSLTPGRYTLTCEVPGFKRYSREAVTLTANARVSVDIVLELGDVTQSVTISAGAPLLETGTASVGQSIVAQHLSDLPMSGRAPMVLTRLAIGVTTQTRPTYNTRPFDTGGTSGMAIGGGRSMTNEILMDGMPNMSRYRCIAYNPPLDSVQEVKIEVFQSDAAYGNTGSGTINMVIKSGTNQFHGALGLFNQTSAFASNLFYTRAAGIKKGENTYWQWGGNAGGPVVIPKVINGKDKLFWFFAYDGIYNFRPVPGGTTFTVPTEAMRKGDFSALLPFGSAYQLYDPASTVAEGSRRRRQPLTGNIIPQNLMNVIAKNYLTYYPMPNQSGILNGQQNNYLSTPADTDDYWNYLGRMDLNATDRHKLFIAGYSNWRRVDYQNYWPGVGTGVYRYRMGSGGHIDDVYLFGPSTYLNTRIGWSRFGGPDKRRSDGFDITSLGFPAYMAAASIQPLMPGITFSDATRGVGGLDAWNDPYVSEQAFATLTKVASRHTLKFGSDIRRYRQNMIRYQNSAGTFRFGPDWMNGPLDNSPGAPLGQGVASLLLGLPASGGFDINAHSSYKSWYAAVFLQDDWRPRSNLTVNIGLRYEKETPTTERFNRAAVGFDFSSPNAITVAATQAYARNANAGLPVSQFRPVGGPIFADAEHRQIYRTRNRSFSPRVGLSYVPGFLGRRTVIRAGWGMFYHTYGTLPFGEYDGPGQIQLGFSETTPFVATLDGYLTPYATLSNPFPGGINRPGGAAKGLDTNLGSTIDTVNSNLGGPYMLRWNFSVQRELAQNLMAEAAYIGSHGVHLTFDRDLNFVPRSALSTSPFRDQTTINMLTSNVANPFAGLVPNTSLNGSTVALSQLLRPYPQYYGDNSLRTRPENLGYSIYHLLGVRIDKRFSHGLQVLTSWSFSKMIAATSMLNPSDPAPERKVPTEDRPQVLVLSGSYELPFGKGKLLGASASPWQRALIGGWKLGGIATIQSGAALAWGNVIYYGGDIRLNPRAIGGAFDKTKFNTISAQQLAQNIRSFPSAFSNLREDGICNLDLTLQKETPIKERFRLQFRVDAFNALNRTQFAGPTLTPTSAAFGQITSQANISRFMQMSLRLAW
jgi:hypothetical protein